MASVTLALARTALVDPWTVVLAAGCALVLIRFRPNPTWVVLGGAGAGFLIQALLGKAA
jgi:chromate transporter